MQRPKQEQVKKESFTEQVEQVLEAHYQDERFGVHQLAGQLHLSRSQLHRKLVAFAGKSATAYIREFRLKKSLILLSEGERTVAEVAYECGFSSPSYFNTCFSKRYGYPPGEVRQRQASVAAKAALAGRETSRSFPANEVSSHSNRPGHAKRQLLLIAGIALLSFAGIAYLGAGNPETELGNNGPRSDRSIAVMPLLNTAGDEKMEAVCEGITDDLIARLENYPGIDRVISRISTFQFKGSKAGAGQISKALGVTYVLQGRLMPLGSRMKMNAQLFERHSDTPIWEQDYFFDWDFNAIFRIQSELADAVARELELQLPESGRGRVSQPPTKNKEAYDNYVQGVYQAYKLDEKSLLNAEALLTRAIELDPNFAEAYSYLGYIWSARGFGDALEDQRRSSQKAKYYFSKARELDSSLPQNEIYALQTAFYLDWDFKRLEAFYHSDFLNHVYSRETSGLLDYALKTGRFEDALKACERSILVNPLDAVLYSFKARALWSLGRKEEALKTLEQTDMLHDKDWFYLREAAHSYFLMGEYEHSFRVLDLLLSHFEDRSPTIVWLDLMRANQAGNEERVQSCLSELLRAYENFETGSPAWYLALHYIANGESETGLAWLEKSYERFDVEMTWLRAEPILEPLRKNPRYLKLLKEVGFPE